MTVDAVATSRWRGFFVLGKAKQDSFGITITQQNVTALSIGHVTHAFVVFTASEHKKTPANFFAGAENIFQRIMAA